MGWAEDHSTQLPGRKYLSSESYLEIILRNVSIYISIYIKSVLSCAWKTRERENTVSGHVDIVSKQNLSYSKTKLYY